MPVVFHEFLATIEARAFGVTTGDAIAAAILAFCASATRDDNGAKRGEGKDAQPDQGASEETS
jgi:hypothetical protein